MKFYSCGLYRVMTVAFLFVSFCAAQKDPGVRGGPPGAGGPLPGLNQNELALFMEGRARSTQLEAVCDTCSDVTLGANSGEDPNLATLTNSSGLGARFNGDQCSVCHMRPRLADLAASSCPIPRIPQTSSANVKIRCST